MLLSPSSSRSSSTTTAAALLLLLSCSLQPSTVIAQKSQSKILEIFYDQANGDSWTNKQWNTTHSNVCNSNFYPGVTCNDDKQIIEIDLHNCGLSGKVTPWIYALPELTTLKLGDNEIDTAGWDQIDDVASVDELGFELGTKLTSVTLTSNKISSVEGITKLADSLKELHLTYNRIAGPMPEELFALKNLKVFSISENKITGPIDTRLANLTHLNEFYCYGNKVTGQIPEEIGQLKKLQILTVSFEMFCVYEYGA